VAAMFDQRELLFELQEEEKKLLLSFMRDEFYVRKFGDLTASKLATNELRKYISDHIQRKVNNENDYKLVLLLGHDNTMSALLSAMQIP
jgi:hypothetical protein